MESDKEIANFFWIGTIAMISIAFALTLIVVFYKNSLSKHKKQEAELLLQTSLISEKNERKRIAADLHDSVSSDLSAIRNYLVIILKDEKNLDRVSLFQDLKEGVDIAIENTRMVSYKLMPPLLDSLGLIEALKDYTLRLEKNTNLKFVVQSEQEINLNLDSFVSYELYRIIQEFVTNMLKYGAIKNCIIDLKVFNSCILITLKDDGNSFDFYKELEISTGAGLHNINSRLKVLRAKMIQHEIVKGNHLEIILPIKNTII